MSQDSIREAAVAIREGKVVAFPTDTVYGVGCDPFNQEAVRRVITAKNRGGAPLSILVENAKRAREIGKLETNGEKLASAFWPGAVTVVVLATRELPEEVTGSTGTVGLRVPARDDLLELIRLSGGALIGTSANISGHPSSKSAEEVEREIGDGVDLILDGGPAEQGIESSVVRVDSEGVHIVREKAVTREQVFRALGDQQGE